MQAINFWPILVASLVGFGFSALWYSPILFGRQWISLVQMTESDIDEVKSRGIWKLYIVQFVMIVISFCVMAFFITESNSFGASNGAFIGFLAWLGFTATNAISGFLWEKYPFKLMLIDTISVLITLVIGGAILGAWR